MIKINRFDVMYIKFQFRHHIKRGLQKTPCCKHRIKTASRQRDDDVIDKTHHQMYASTASITHNNGIQLSLEQTLAPSSTNSGSSGSGPGSGSTSSTGTASSGEQPLTNSKEHRLTDEGDRLAVWRRVCEDGWELTM